MLYFFCSMRDFYLGYYCQLQVLVGNPGLKMYNYTEHSVLAGGETDLYKEIIMQQK